MDYSLPVSYVLGISQARILEWIAISISRGSSWPRDRTHISFIGRWILYHWAIREALWLYWTCPNQPGLSLHLKDLNLRHLFCHIRQHFHIFQELAHGYLWRQLFFLAQAPAECRHFSEDWDKQNPFPGRDYSWGNTQTEKGNTKNMFYEIKTNS